MPAPARLYLARDDEADTLLAHDPFALLVGMVLDQQIPMERAFAAPAELARRLGQPLDPVAIAAYDPDAFAALFARPPALHRFPSAMAARVQAVAALVTDRYGGSAERLWAEAATGAELRARLGELPGFGVTKAQIFLALLAKQFGVRPPGWEAAAGEFATGAEPRSVADIVDDASLAAVRAYKASRKPAARSRTSIQGGGH